MPLEESGNMLIMTLSYVQKTNDLSLLTTYVCYFFGFWSTRRLTMVSFSLIFWTNGRNS